MERTRELVVTFRLDASDYQDQGSVSALAFARQQAWELIFQRAQFNVLETMMHAATRPTGNETLDILFRQTLEGELEAIRAAALSATYEIVEVSQDRPHQHPS